MGIIKLLKAVSLFKNFDTGELHSVLSLVELNKYEPNQYIFKEGDRDHSLYIIVDGSVRIIKEFGMDEEIELAFMRKGDYFGELSLIDYQPRSATVRTFEETEVLKLTDLGYQELSRKFPTAEVKMLRAFVIDISHRLRTTNDMWSHFKNLIF